MRLNEAIRRFLTKILQAKELAKSEPVTLVLDIGSEAAQVALIHHRSYELLAANVGAGATPLRLGDQGTQPVLGLVLEGGPRGDGATANTSRIFLGNEHVAIGAGRVLAVGSVIEIRRWADLADLYIVGLTAGDLLRASWYE